MLRLCFSAFLLLLILPSYDEASTNLERVSGEIRAAMDSRDFSRAEQLIRALRRENPAAFTANNYDYLLARLAAMKGAEAEAASIFLEVLDRSSILSQYAIWHLAALARSSGDLALERQYVSRLLSANPSSALATRARERLVENAYERGDYRAAISMLRGSASASGVRGRSAAARLAQAYVAAGDLGSARALYEQLASGSRDDYALIAAGGLDRLDAASGNPPGEFEALRRARIYLANRHWSEARAHLLHITGRFPDSANRAEALYQIGFTHYREDDQDQAIEWFERVHSEFPSRKEGEQGFYWVATALQRAARYEPAARRYQEFIDRFPSSELVEGAYRNTVDCLRYANRDDEALTWSRRMIERYSGRALATVGLFNEARIEMARGRYQAAYAALSRVEARPVSSQVFGAPIRGEAAFLKIYTLERMGRHAEAARLYLSIPEGRDNYFGHRATARLQAMAATEEGSGIIESLFRRYQDQARAAARAGRHAEAKDAANQALRLTGETARITELLEILRRAYGRLPAYSSISRHRLIPGARPVITDGRARSGASNRTLAAELLFLGLYDEGSVELRLGGFGGARAVDFDREGVPSPSGEAQAIMAAASQGTGDIAYSMAVYSNRGDHAHHAISFGEPVLRSAPQDYRVELLPGDLAELLYPAPYREALTRYSTGEVDTRLILAIARQESRFNPTAKSPASARGLLQFIPETARRMAEEEGLDRFQLDDVYDPIIAVRLAARYVGNLFRLFPGNGYAVAASYNTGELNVERWISRARSDEVDALVAEIAIPETKDYVAKVISNYVAYSRLYTGDLKPAGRR